MRQTDTASAKKEEILAVCRIFFVSLSRKTSGTPFAFPNNETIVYNLTSKTAQWK
jgi:hypothetical protein